jgi:CRP/FNR family transcriptional regulator
VSKIEHNAPAGPPAIPDELWEQLVQVGKRVRYRPGETIYFQDDANDGIFCVEHGRVKVSQVLSDGTEAFLNQFTDRCMFGEATALGGSIGNPTAVAQTEVTALLLPTQKIRELMNTNSDFAWFMANSLVHKLTASTIQLGAIAGKRVMSRLASALLILDYYGVLQDETHTWYLITHAELASLIDTTRSNATALLRRLAQQNLIEQRRNRVRILDPEGLKELSQTEEDVPAESQRIKNKRGRP